MIILDTSFLISFEAQGDVNHEKAVALMEAITNEKYGTPLISDYIFDETVTVTLVRSGRLGKASLVGDALGRSFQILRVDESLFESAWRLFKSQGRTRLSFTDCTTVALMQRNGIGDIATFDKEFSRIKGVTVIA